MMKRILREVRHTAGFVLQTVATRLLSTPTGLQHLKGDALTEVGAQYGCERENDATFRAAVTVEAHKQVGDKARYRQ